MTSVLRQRKAQKAIAALKEIDAFTKVPEECVEQTRSGGTISLFSYFIMICLIYSEVMDYLESTHYTFQFTADSDFTDSKLKINLDMTVASDCDSIGLDIIDKTKEILPTYGNIEEEPVYFALTENQRQSFESMREFNSFLSQQFHDVAESALRSQYAISYRYPVINKPSPHDKRPVDGCHFHGSIETHKTAGVLHIIQGKSVPIPGLGHAHLNINFGGFGFTPANFSHRIHRFSFGEIAPGFVHPLDADEKIDPVGRMNYQYFIQIVPTEVVTLFRTIRTYQYSVTEQDRLIDHDKGSHGQPGIFIKWDLSGIKVIVTENHEDFTRFITRLCALVGGIFATSGMVSSIVASLMDYVGKITREHCPLGVAVGGMRGDGHTEVECPLLPNSPLTQQPPSNSTGLSPPIPPVSANGNFPS